MYRPEQENKQRLSYQLTERDEISTPATVDLSLAAVHAVLLGRSMFFSENKRTTFQDYFDNALDLTGRLTQIKMAFFRFSAKNTPTRSPI